MHIGFSADQKMNESTILLINDVQKLTSGDKFLQKQQIFHETKTTKSRFKSKCIPNQFKNCFAFNKSARRDRHKLREINDT